MTTSDFEGFAQPASEEQYNDIQGEREGLEFTEPGEREWSPEAVERATTMVEELEMQPTILYQMSGMKSLETEFRPSWLRDPDDPNIEVIVREFHGTAVELDEEELEALATRVAELMRRRRSTESWRRRTAAGRTRKRSAGPSWKTWTQPWSRWSAGSSNRTPPT